MVMEAVPSYYFHAIIHDKHFKTPLLSPQSYYEKPGFTKLFSNMSNSGFVAHFDSFTKTALTPDGA